MSLAFAKSTNSMMSDIFASVEQNFILFADSRGTRGAVENFFRKMNCDSSSVFDHTRQEKLQYKQDESN